jgi:hypothetical protein
VFLGLQVVYRKELAHRREDCRRLATKLLESRLARPQGVGERNGSEPVVWAPAPDTGLAPVEITTGQQTDSSTRVQATA